MGAGQLQLKGPQAQRDSSGHPVQDLFFCFPSVIQFWFTWLTKSDNRLFQMHQHSNLNPLQKSYT